MQGVIKTLRFVAGLFYGIFLWLIITICVMYATVRLVPVILFGCPFLLALIVMPKVHKSTVMTRVLIIATSIIPVWIFLLFLHLMNKDIIGPIGIILLLIAFLLPSSLPVLLYLEHKRHKHT